MHVGILRMPQQRLGKYLGKREVFLGCRGTRLMIKGSRT